MGCVFVVRPDPFNCTIVGARQSTFVSIDDDVEPVRGIAPGQTFMARMGVVYKDGMLDIWRQGVEGGQRITRLVKRDNDGNDLRACTFAWCGRAS